MEMYRLLLEDRIRLARTAAANHPTTEHLTDFGRAIMDRWAANPTPTLEFEAAMQLRILRLLSNHVDSRRRYPDR
jgi:hypothetical protein